MKEKDIYHTLGLLAEEILGGRRLEKAEALELCRNEDPPALFALMSAAQRLRLAFKGSGTDLCSIVNAKSGACPEDCSYCAQSSRARAEIETYPLISEERLLEHVRSAREAGAHRFCIVTSGRRPGKTELDRIAGMVSMVSAEGLKPCATLGLLDKAELETLKAAGLVRYHHNLETSRRNFPRVSQTHTYSDKIETIEAALSAGLSVCSGGIFGLGESWEDRLDMALELRRLDVDSIPINFFTPVAGTPSAEKPKLAPGEALRITALMRLMLPDKGIRICGGRPQTMGELQSWLFAAGADSLLIGHYLTTTGRNPEDDLSMLKELGLD